MSIPRFDKATENLVRWSTREEWLEPQMETYTAHTAPVADILDVSDDEFEELIGDVADMLGVFILEDFFTLRFGEDGEINVVDDYLKRRGWRETAPGRRYLESLRDSVTSLYEVVGIDPGRSLTVRDLVRGGEAVTVHEKLGSKSAAPWDRLAARIVEVSGKMYFTGAVLRFRHELSLQFLSLFDETAKEMEKDITEEARRVLAKSVDIRSVVRGFILDGRPGAQMFTHIWLLDTILQAQAPLPALHNTDDEPIVFCRVRFPIVGEEPEVATMLDGIECFERGQDLLASCLGDLVGPPLVSHRDPKTAAEEHAGQPDAEPEIPLDAAVQVIHSCLDDYYRCILDEPHPSVDGKTLRQAAKTRKGREKVIDWLKKLENTEHRRAVQRRHRPYDTSWLWRELGIETPR